MNTVFEIRWRQQILLNRVSQFNLLSSLINNMSPTCGGRTPEKQQAWYLSNPCRPLFNKMRSTKKKILHARKLQRHPAAHALLFCLSWVSRLLCIYSLSPQRRSNLGSLRWVIFYWDTKDVKWEVREKGCGIALMHVIVTAQPWH